MTIEEILNTDHFTALPEGTVVEEELNCQESDEEIERLPNISTLLRASEFIDLCIINDQATVQATSVTATVQTMPATAMPGTPIPATAMPGSAVPATAAPATTQSEDSAADLPSEISAAKRRQDLTETQHVTEFPQQEDVTETQLHVTTTSSI